MIDVISTENTRLAAGDTLLNLYTATAVYLAIARKRMDTRYVDLLSGLRQSGPFFPDHAPSSISCYAVFYGNKSSAFTYMQNARRQQEPPRLIVAFGPFAAAFPQEILSHGLADIVVGYDPEFVIPALIEAFQGSCELSRIPNITYMHAAEMIQTARFSFTDLDDVPFVSPYLYRNGYKPALIVTARGCPNQCVYCDRNALWGGDVRKRSVENILKEIEEVVAIDPLAHIEFLDEDFVSDHQRLISLCEGMRRIKGHFSWQCCARIDSVNPKVLSLMKMCRCRDIYFGMESASPKVLKRIGKTYKRQDILNAIHWAQSAGLKVGVMITKGNPGETERDRRLTMLTLKVFGPNVPVTTNELVILPGTPFFFEGLEKGWFSRKSYFEDEGVFLYDETRNT